MELWKDIKGFGNRYSVSTEGRVRSNQRELKSGKIRPEKILKLSRDTGGYLSFCSCLNGSQKRLRVHKLVAEHFLGPSDNMVVNHIDSNKLNNRLENLEYVSQRVNVEKWYKKSKEGLPVGITKAGTSSFRATVWVGNKVALQKQFKTLEQAISARKDFLSTLNPSC
jgi:hypothetical protein